MGPAGADDRPGKVRRLAAAALDPFRYLKRHGHEQASGAFGSGGFGAVAETAPDSSAPPGYIVGQSVVVAAWVAVNTGAY